MRSPGICLYAWASYALVSISAVNCMWCSTELMCWWNWSMSDVARAQRVSSTLPILGGQGKVAKTLFNILHD